MIHYFEEFEVIRVQGNRAVYSTEIRILCGAQQGQADNRKEEVTCLACRRKLKRKAK